MSQEKKTNPVKTIIISVLAVLIVLALTYCVPYYIANTNSRGWYETGRYAEANIYPGLAVNAYHAALERFPKENTYPQGDIVDEARDRMYALKDKMSGIPFQSISKMLQKGDFKAIAAMVDAGGLDLAKLRLDFFSKEEKQALEGQINEVGRSLKRIVGFQEEGHIVYSDDYKVITLETLQENLRSVLNSFIQELKTGGIFFPEDSERIENLFQRDMEKIAALKADAGLARSLEIIAGSIKQKAGQLNRMLGRRHVQHVQKVARLAGELNSDIEEARNVTTKMYKVRDEVQDHLGKLKRYQDADKKLLATKRSSLDGYIKTLKEKIGNIVKNAKELGGILQKPLTRVKQLEDMDKEWNAFIGAVSNFDRKAEGYFDGIKPLIRRKKELEKKRSTLSGGKQLMAVMDDIRKVEKKIKEALFLPWLEQSRGNVEKALNAFDLELINLKSMFADKTGRIDMNGAMVRKADKYQQDYISITEKVRVSTDGRLLLVNDSYTSQKLVDKIDREIEKIYKTIAGKNEAMLASYIQSGEKEKLVKMLETVKYWEGIKKEYRNANCWRLEYMDFLSGAADKQKREAILKKIQNFPFFYKKNGFLGERLETTKMNREILIPAAMKVLTSGASLGDQYRNLVKVLQKEMMAK